MPLLIMTDKNVVDGILTLATPSDYLKAIGLALSLKITNPDLPRAVACNSSLFTLLEPYFDYCIEERCDIRGFAHKVFLDKYSPFENTLFLDSDVLVFQSVHSHVALWPDQAYSACGKYRSDGVSAFGLERSLVLRRLGVKEMVCIDGAGHAFFRKSLSGVVFDRARFITSNYSEFAGNAKYADEDVMNIVMTELGLQPAKSADFFSRYLSAVSGTINLNASEGVCEFISHDTGRLFAPCMMHFAADEAPLAYTRYLWRLYATSGVSTSGLLSLGLKDYYRQHIRNPISRLRQRLFC
ncbi:MAG: hypothetical protein IPN53_01215 [Comamonadaceae bacterium]|nr:hypothetical protein [Comamonadaceae bacterium]